MKIKETNPMGKKIALLTLGVLAVAALAKAAWVYNAYLVNETSLAYSKNYVLNLNTTPNASGIKSLTAQAVYSSATLATNTFTDGKVSTGSLTVVSTAPLVSAFAVDKITMPSTAQLTPVAATNYFTVTSTTGLSGQYITINGNIVQDSKFIAGTASGTATGLNSYLNTYYANQFISTVTVGGTTIYSTATVAGSAGNVFTFASSTPSALSSGGPNFAGGTDSALNNAYIVVNGIRYRQGYLWRDTGLSSTTAKSFHDNVLQFIPGIVSTVTAGSNIVYATATVAGTAGNGFSFSASPATIVVANANFTGGQDPAQFCINGTCLTEGVQWSLGASSTTATTAASIKSAINASSALNTILTSSNTTGSSVVTATSTAAGTISNYSLTSSAPAALSVSGPTMVAGANAAYAVNTPTINIPNHGLSTAYAVLFSTPAGTGITPLVNQTTYYVIVVDANNVQLATTSARAQAGQAVTLTSLSTAGPHTFTLAPLVFTGTAGLQWQVSNDCIAYTPLTTTVLGVAVSSLTFATPFTAGNTTWNLGPVNWQCIEAAVAGPTTGGFAITVRLNGSD